jgi:hypothetical protein
MQPLVGRIEDLPYVTSPPIQFCYESTAALAAGSYTWADAPSPLTVPRPLLENGLYFLRSITVSADVEEGDFMGSISTVPLFTVYTLSGQSVMLYREPFRVNRFYDQFDYRLVWRTRRSDDRLLAAFSGVLTQTAHLIVKMSITLKAVIAAQEIVDDGFIATVEKRYPAMEGGSR